MLTLRIAVRGRHKESGFTLIEMLISLAIFALIGVSAYQVLASSALISEREQKRTERMHELDRALRILERDLRQALDRQVRDELGPRLAFFGEEDGLLEFTRAGNDNPLGLARSDLLRVQYSLREPEASDDEEDAQQSEESEDTLNLLRTLSRMPDSSLETPVNEQHLLSNVVSFTARFMDENLTWHDAWPLPEGQGTTNSNNAALPAAIELTLVIAGTGELRRVISLR